MDHFFNVGPGGGGGNAWLTTGYLRGVSDSKFKLGTTGRSLPTGISGEKGLSSSPYLL